MLYLNAYNMCTYCVCLCTQVHYIRAILLHCPVVIALFRLGCELHASLPNHNIVVTLSIAGSIFFKVPTVNCAGWMRAHPLAFITDKYFTNACNWWNRVQPDKPNRERTTADFDDMPMRCRSAARLHAVRHSMPYSNIQRLPAHLADTLCTPIWPQSIDACTQPTAAMAATVCNKDSIGICAYFGSQCTLSFRGAKTENIYITQQNNEIKTAAARRWCQ